MVELRELLALAVCLVGYYCYYNTLGFSRVIWGSRLFFVPEELGILSPRLLGWK